MQYCIELTTRAFTTKATVYDGRTCFEWDRAIRALSTPCDQLTDVVVKGKVAIHHEAKVFYCTTFSYNGCAKVDLDWREIMQRVFGSENNKLRF